MDQPNKKQLRVVHSHTAKRTNGMMPMEKKIQKGSTNPPLQFTAQDAFCFESRVLFPSSPLRSNPPLLTEPTGCVYDLVGTLMSVNPRLAHDVVLCVKVPLPKEKRERERKKDHQTDFFWVGGKQETKHLLFELILRVSKTSQTWFPGYSPPPAALSPLPALLVNQFHMDRDRENRDQCYKYTIMGVYA